MVICVIGGGGKTAACRRVARELADRWVLFTTTTHIYPLQEPECRLLLIDPEEQALLQALKQPGIVCAGTRSREGKLAGLPEELLQRAVAQADVTVCEADGAKHLPLKLHREFEPVLLPGTDLCLVVAGLSALGKPVGEAVHCYDRNPAWKQEPERIVGIEEFLYCLRENLQQAGGKAKECLVLLNQADVLSDPAPAMELKNILTGNEIGITLLDC